MHEKGFERTNRLSSESKVRGRVKEGGANIEVELAKSRTSFTNSGNCLAVTEEGIVGTWEVNGKS